MGPWPKSPSPGCLNPGSPASLPVSTQSVSPHHGPPCLLPDEHTATTPPLPSSLGALPAHKLALALGLGAEEV